MTISVSKKSDFDSMPDLIEPASNFKKSLSTIQIPALLPFQLGVFEKYFLAATKEDSFPEQREKFQDLIEARLARLGEKLITPYYISKLRYFLLMAFDCALSKREPIFSILDRWIDREIISFDDGIEIFELVKRSLFYSQGEEEPRLKINKSSFSDKLLSIKGRAFLRDDHIALFSKVVEAIQCERTVDKAEEFDLFLSEFLICLERQNQEIKDFHLNRLKNSLILEERACSGQLLAPPLERRSTPATLISQTEIERCAATPKCVIASARYWYTRAFDELLKIRDPFNSFLDYLFDQGCISFKPLEQLCSASQEVLTLWNTGMREATRRSRIEHKLEVVQIHIGPRFDKIFQSQQLVISQKTMVEIFSHFLFSPCPNYLVCFIQLIKECAQQLHLDEDESIQLFKAYFDIGSGVDYQFLYNLCESNFSLDALFRFNSHFNENPDIFISVYSQLDQEQIYRLAKGYIEGGVEELKLRLSKMDVDRENAEKFLSAFIESE